MSDLYERLLAEVKAIDWAVRLAGLPPEPLGSPDATTLADALRAVLELHKPQPCSRPCSLRHEHVSCGSCRPPDFHVELKWWPCDTVRAVARALDIEIGDHQ